MNRPGRITVILFACLAAASPAVSIAAGSPDIVISQIYGGGRTTESTYKADFVELFNRGTAPVDVAGWTLRGKSVVIGEWSMATPPLVGVIPPGGYYLVQAGPAASGVQDLPAPDHVSDGQTGNTGNTIMLVRDAVNDIVGGCPSGPRIADLVSLNNLSCAEGTPAPGHYLTTATLRQLDGCQDTDDNAADFFVAAPNPRNSASPVHLCAAVGIDRPTAVPAPTGLGRPWPNPASGLVRIPFGLVRTGEVEVSIFDLQGRRVRRLTREVLAAGPHERSWDGKDERGAAVPNGLYLVRLTAGPELGPLWTRIVLAR